VRGAGMARCPAHGNRIQQTPSGAVNLFGATPQPDCRRTVADQMHHPGSLRAGVSVGGGLRLLVLLLMPDCDRSTLIITRPQGACLRQAHIMPGRVHDVVSRFH